MTKRKDPSELKIRPRDDLTPQKDKKKSGFGATEEGKQARLLALRKYAPNNDVENYNPDRPLTQKMKIFAREWAAGETILSASLRAGYSDSGSMAYKLARDPAILKIYNAEKKLYEETCQMTRKKVMEGLLEGVEMAKLQGDAGNVIAGWREIGKMAGYYEPVRRKIDINVKGDVTMKHLERLPDVELLKLIKGEVEDVLFREIEEAEATDE